MSMQKTSHVSMGQRRTFPSSILELYIVIEALSGDYHKYLDSTHEVVQVLHTAYVYSFEDVLLSVGDSSGNTIRGE